jgi:hypothetical protein
MRVVLALQRLPRRLAALDPVLALARDLGAAVTALFVEDPGLLACAALPVVREVDHWSGEVRELDRPGLERRLATEAGARAVAVAERLAAAAGKPLVVASSATRDTAPAGIPGRRRLTLPEAGLPAFLRALSPYEVAACVVAEAHAMPLGQRFRAFGSGRDCLLVYVE